MSDDKPKVVPCSSCGAKVIWITNEDGKPMPVNATRVRGYRLFRMGQQTHGEWTGELVYVSHFVSCPNATKHSKGGRGAGA